MTSKTASAQAQKPAVATAASGALQRNCACGNHSFSGGECTNCAKKKLQRKLTIGATNDPLELEADLVAEQVLANKPAHSFSNISTPKIQRRAEQASAQTEEVPTSVERVLAGSGSALPIAVRKDMEERFGKDFSQVRMHTGSAAEKSAQDVNANAYTVGNNIVFNRGKFSPDTQEGKRLLAHELTHVVQQSGSNTVVERSMESGAQELTKSGRILQRQCTPSPLPPAPIPIGSFPPTPAQAETCLQSNYAATHPNSKPGISLGFNIGWRALSGKDLAERQALTCLNGGTTKKAGPNFTAKHGMYAGQPDIWDFANRTMYEITTPGQVSFKSGSTGKLAAQVALANAITGSDMDCGGLAFSTGDWVPSPPTFRLDSGLYIAVTNMSGVLSYQTFKDGTKEVALIALMVMMKAMVDSMKKGGGGAVAGGAGGRAAPAYAIASLVATAILLGSGKAEAKAGPGNEEPIVQLLEALAQKGTPVPPEIQKMIQDDPALRSKVNKAMSEGGDPTAAQQEINDQILKIIADNPDQFTKEDLETLTTMTTAAGKALPKGQVTADTTRKMLDKIKAGDTGGSGGSEGKKNVWDKAREAGEPKTSATEKPKGDAPAAAGEKINVWDKAKYPKLKDESVQKIGVAKGPVKALFNAWTQKGQGGPDLTDAAVTEFFATVPPDLTVEQANTLITQLAAAEGKTADEALASLKAAVKEIMKKTAEAEAVTAEGVVSSIEPPKPGAETTTNAELVAKLAGLASKGDYSGLGKGTIRLTWNKEVGNSISATVKAIDAKGVRSAGQVHAEIIKRESNGKTLTIRFTMATPLISADGRTVRNSSAIVGQISVITLLDKKAK